MSAVDFDPLFGEAREEIPLPEAPLTCVVAQVQFSPIMKLGDQGFIANLQENLRSEYPRLDQTVIPVLNQFGAESLGKISSETMWRFSTNDFATRVTVSTTFISLEMRKYKSRTDFMGRLRKVIAALLETVSNAQVSRVGIRYVDQVKAPQVESISEMLRQEMLGTVNTRLEQGAVHVLTETLCNVKEGSLLARWGKLPANATHDPNVMPPVESESWFFDVDVFKQYQDSFVEMNPDQLHDVVRDLAARQYAFFRWAVTDTFLRAYGGEIK